MIRFFDTVPDYERCLETYVNYVQKQGTTGTAIRSPNSPDLSRMLGFFVIPGHAQR